MCSTQDIQKRLLCLAQSSAEQTTDRRSGTAGAYTADPHPKQKALRELRGSPWRCNEQGFKCGKNRVARIMKDHSICAEVKKRRFRRTTDSRHDYALAANLLIDQGQTEGVWASDITFVSTSEGWLYVAAVMNVKSRRVIGLSMS